MILGIKNRVWPHMTVLGPPIRTLADLRQLGCPYQFQGETRTVCVNQVGLTLAFV